MKKEGNGKIGGINSDKQTGDVGFMNGKAMCVSRYPGEGGCSKILHKCDFEKEEHDLYFYCPKVSKSERGENNNHPTLKPQKLLTNILSLFKTPNEQVLLDPFSGSFSIPLVCEKLGYKWIACEQNEDYFNIGINRLNSLQK